MRQVPRHPQRLCRARGRRLLRRLRPQARRAGPLRPARWSEVQDVIMSAVGGENVTTTVEGRERYPVNVRYPRELRDDLDAPRRVLVTTPAGRADPAGPGRRDPDGDRPVHDPQRERPARRLRLRGHRAAATWAATSRRPSRPSPQGVTLPAGYSLDWSGQYENMLRVRERLKIVVPLTLFLIFFLLYMNTKSAVKTADRHARRAVLAGRRGVAAVGARLQHLDRGLGRHDRPHGPRRRDRRLHAPLPRPLLRRGQAQGPPDEPRRPRTRPSSTARSSASGRR